MRKGVAPLNTRKRGTSLAVPVTAYTTDEIVIKSRLFLGLAPATSEWEPPTDFSYEEPEPELPDDLTWWQLLILFLFGLLYLLSLLFD